MTIYDLEGVPRSLVVYELSRILSAQEVSQLVLVHVLQQLFLVGAAHEHNLLPSFFVQECFDYCPDACKYPRSIDNHELAELLRIIVLRDGGAELDEALNTFIEHGNREASHVEDRECVEHLLFGDIAASKEVQLDDLFVSLHEVAYKRRLIDDLPNFRRLHRSCPVNVDGSSNFVYAHVAFCVVLLQLELCVAR